MRPHGPILEDRARLKGGPQVAWRLQVKVVSRSSTKFTKPGGRPLAKNRTSSSCSSSNVSGYKVSLPMLIFVPGNEINDVVAAN